MTRRRTDADRIAAWREMEAWTYTRAARHDHEASRSEAKGLHEAATLERGLALASRKEAFGYRLLEYQLIWQREREARCHPSAAIVAADNLTKLEASVRTERLRREREAREGKGAPRLTQVLPPTQMALQLEGRP